MLSRINSLPLLLCVALLMSMAAASNADETITEAQAKQEIHYLLQYIADSGATFIRNGDEHSARDAADHLAMKYRRASRYAKTAEDFIDNLASKSSFTGKPYTVVTADGKDLKSHDWLYAALNEYRQNPNSQSPAAPAE